MAALPLLFVLPAVLGLLPTTTLAKYGRNYLLSGQTIPTDGRLSYGDYDLIVQRDCSLILYDGWNANTTGKGKDCSLTLDNYGKLTLKDGTGHTVWTSSSSSTPKGEYAALLRPDGMLVVYGPTVWSTPLSSAGGITRRDVPLLGNTALAKNFLLSGQILYEGGSLTNRNFLFIMQVDCNLVLYHGFWMSNTHGNGKFCFLRLDHQGKLTIKDDRYYTVWSSYKMSSQGDYVFLLQDDGKGVVYGPVVWSTKPGKQTVTEAEGIAMVTAGEK